MSHFVSSEIRGRSHECARRSSNSRAARAAFPHFAASLANSSGIFLRQRPIYDLARPGYALYGGNPTPGAPNPMRPVATLTVAIQQTRWIEARHDLRLQRPVDREAPHAARDAAGRLRRRPAAQAGATDSKPGAEVVVAGRRCPLVGRVSMDICVADVTDLPEDAARAGDRVEVIGPSADLDEFAARSGTIGYQMLTGLGSRYRREYIGKSIL